MAVPPRWVIADAQRIIFIQKTRCQVGSSRNWRKPGEPSGRSGRVPLVLPEWSGMVLCVSASASRPGWIHSRKEIAMSKKTNCPITREQFRSRARPVSITVCDVPMIVPTKEFSTGSLGWYLNGKTVIEIDGTPVQVQLGLNLTIIGRKEFQIGRA